jgi:hypothetical protein
MNTWLLMVLACAAPPSDTPQGRGSDVVASSTASPTSATTPTLHTPTSTDTSTSTPDEICNGVDDDGDGLVDEDDPSLDLATALSVFADVDGDGFGAGDSRWVCSRPPSSSKTPGDCDDLDPDSYPGAPANDCDGRPDTNCDGLPDPGEVDGDHDGFALCDDCNDEDAAVHPSAREVCDAQDTDCNGLIDDHAEPSSCGWCPEADRATMAKVVYEERMYNPCILDEEAFGLCYHLEEDPEDTHEVGRRLHRATWRNDVPLRRQLFLYLPPGSGEDTTAIPGAAAYAGFRTISLGYVNNAPLNEACGELHESPADCYTHSRYEVLFGEDRSDVVSITLADSAVRRLEVLLAQLVLDAPDAGWDDLLEPDGSVRWIDVVVGGWSEGSGHAAYLAMERKLDGVLMFSGPQDIYPNPEGGPIPLLAEWAFEPRATAACVHHGILNTEDNNDRVEDAWVAFGIDTPWADVDTVAAPYGDSRKLSTSLVMAGCTPHQSIGRDGCVRADMIEPYLQMMCTAAATDPDCGG